jgi:hypothetical protein
MSDISVFDVCPDGMEISDLKVGAAISVEEERVGGGDLFVLPDIRKKKKK